MSISSSTEYILTKAESGASLTREDIIALLKIPGDYLPDLFAAADRVRKEQVGDEIFLRGIIEFSNFCERNCLYCGLRQSNSNLSRYRMTDDEILDTVQNIKNSRVPTVVLQSGEDSFYTTDRICRLIERIRNLPFQTCPVAWEPHGKISITHCLEAVKQQAKIGGWVQGKSTGWHRRSGLNVFLHQASSNYSYGRVSD